MVTPADIQAARQRLKDAVFLSPCTRSESLSRMTGCQVFLKLENLQMTGSFKERGSLNKILQLDDAQKAAGVITASAGNHAQSVAHAAKISGIRATIVMPETAPLTKVRGTREFGAEVILYGESYDEACQKALEVQRRHGQTMVHAFDDPDVIAGQGTIGLELLEQVPDMDAVVVPVGGGGLIAGIATAIKAARPGVAVVGVEAERMPAMKQSLAAGRIVPRHPANTIADGIAVAKVGHHTLPIVERCVSLMVTVTEEEMAIAIMTLLEREKTLAEGAGATGFAALQNRKIPDVAGKKVVVVVSGGNIDMNRLTLILERGLENDGRLSCVTVVVPDKPGSIAQLATVAAREGANILHITQNRHAGEVALGETEVELTLETRGHEHAAHIAAALRRQGVTVKGP